MDSIQYENFRFREVFARGNGGWLANAGVATGCDEPPMGVSWS